MTSFALVIIFDHSIIYLLPGCHFLLCCREDHLDEVRVKAVSVVIVIENSFQCIGFDSDIIQRIENPDKCNCLNYDLVQ